MRSSSENLTPAGLRLARSTMYGRSYLGEMEAVKNVYKLTRQVGLYHTALSKTSRIWSRDQISYAD
jgi:hypothetical protein